MLLAIWDLINEHLEVNLTNLNTLTSLCSVNTIQKLCAFILEFKRPFPLYGIMQLFYFCGKSIKFQIY